MQEEPTLASLDTDELIDLVDFNVRTSQVMKMLGCSRQMVCNLIEEGELEAVKLTPKSNGSWRISRKSVVDLVERYLNGDGLRTEGKVWKKK